MSKRSQHIYSIEPQRHVGMGDAGWIICLPSEAERFALIQLTVYKSGRRTYRTHRVLSTYSTEDAARRQLAHKLRRNN